MSEPTHVLVVAHQTASSPGLRDAVHARAQQSPATFHLVVPQRPHGMHKFVDPHDDGREEATAVLAEALPQLSAAAGSDVTGSVGDPEPLMAIHDAINLGSYDEIMLSTLPRRMSKWLRLDLVSKARGLGLPLSHVEAQHGPAQGEAERHEVASSGGR